MAQKREVKTCVFVIFFALKSRQKKWGGRTDLNPASFHYAATSRRPSACAETPADKPGPHARAKPAASRSAAGTRQPTHSRRRAIGWFPSQSVRSTRFRRISFFEPGSYTFLLKIVQHYLHWATRKGGARSEPERRRYAGAGQPIYSRRRAIGWLSSQSVRSTRFRRISFLSREVTLSGQKKSGKAVSPSGILAKKWGGS